MKINLNDTVRFTLTNEGLALVNSDDRKVGLTVGHTLRCWHHKKGVCEAPLWEVMRAFGSVMSMGTTVHPIAKNTLEVVKP